MNMKINTILLFLVLGTYAQRDSNDTSEIKLHKNSDVLSRRKRFLIFAEGSSFQLVFCTTYQMLINIGDIFLWGNTAALAWELPQDPYSPFDHRADPLHRRMDTKTIYYTDEDGRIIDKKPFYRKPIVNPAFAKRSIESDNNEISEKFEIDRQQMHASASKKEYLKSLDQRSVEFHRSSRASLYKKIETMLHGLGVNGRDCVMKTLCLVSQAKDQPQGMFFQEILKAVFIMPENSIEDKHRKYDFASNGNGSCEDLYPDCKDSVLNPDSPTFTYE